MLGLLDVFKIGFESDGLKEFEADLKRNEKSLESYEKEVEKSTKKLKGLWEERRKLKSESQDTDKNKEKLQKINVEIIKTISEIRQAKNQVDFFSTSVETMKKSAEYSLLQVKNNFLKLGKTVARLAIVGATIKKSLDFYEQGEQLQFLAQKAGVASEKLQTLGNAARRYGGTTEGTAGTLENLRSQYQSLRMGEGGGGLEQAAFKYGVSISSDPEKMLENVARRMETLKSDAAKWDLANTLGIDEGTARLLMQGTKAYTEELKRAQKYKLYTKEDLERMRQYRQISLDIRMGIDSIFASIARMLLPAITAVSKVIRAVTDWIAEHEGAIKIIGTLLAITTAVLAARQAVILFGIALDFMNDKGFKAVKAFFKNPFTLWIIAITALIVLINDLIVFMQGGESIIGSILEKFGVDTDKLRNNIKQFFQNIKEWIKGAIDWLKGLGGKFTEFANSIKELWDKIPEPLKKLIGMTNPITGAYTVVTTAKEVMEKVDANKANSVPAGAQSNYYNSASQNETNNKNTENIVNSNTNNSNRSNSNSKTTNIGTVNVTVQSNNPQEFLDNLGVAVELDNGLVSG